MVRWCWGGTVGVEKHVSVFRTDGLSSGLIKRFRTDRAHSGLTQTYAIEHPGERTYLLNASPQTVSRAHAALQQACLCRFRRCIDHSPIPPHPTHAMPRRLSSTHPGTPPHTTPANPNTDIERKMKINKEICGEQSELTDTIQD